ncbi:MAG: hypothetical protein GF329_12065 [Candidatus Lokiarchaeota archaeon]|nr:hypothetical protein [Candidatus Lokiarchaeota archaeon]
MKSLNEYMAEYKKQLKKGDIKEAFRGLMKYLMYLRNHFKKKYPDYYVSGNIYYGYMDMSYFSFTPKIFKNKKLRIAIVFIHEKVQFEVWLSGYNKKIQAKYWKLFKDSNFDKYHIPSSIEGLDSIVEYVLVDNPDFNDLDSLTKQIKDGTLKFINDVKKYLAEHSN